MFHTFLFATILLDNKTPRVTSANSAKLFRGAPNDPLPNFPRDTAIILRVISDLCEEKISDAHMRSLCAIPAPDNNPRPDVAFGGVLAHKIVGFVNKVITDYPLIKLTPLLERGKSHPQPTDFVLVNGILDL